MQKSDFAKIVLGVATGVYLLVPLLLAGLWMITIPFVILANQQYSDPTVLFLFVLFLFSLGASFAGLLHLVLMPIYISLLLRNTSGSLLVRTLLGIGLLFIPFLAAPLYYLLFVAPVEPPAWAREPYTETHAAGGGGDGAGLPEPVHTATPVQSHPIEGAVPLA